MIAPDAKNPVLKGLQFPNEINYAFAVWAPVNKIPKQVQFIFSGQCYLV